MMTDAAAPKAAIDPELARRLRDSFVALLPHGEAFTQQFYDRLFAAAPMLRRHFPADMFEQRGKLLAMLKWTVANLQNHSQLHASLRELGQRHQRYGARPEYYPVVVESMVAALENVVGTSWSRRAEADWRAALGHVAAIMQSAT